ncbi:hypothetical protein AKJ16_DCAP22342 [Drosera capensis]
MLLTNPSEIIEKRTGSAEDNPVIELVNILQRPAAGQRPQETVEQQTEHDRRRGDVWAGGTEADSPDLLCRRWICVRVRHQQVEGLRAQIASKEESVASRRPDDDERDPWSCRMN